MQGQPFTCLGFDAQGRYHFRVSATGLTLRLKAERMSQRALIRLAPIEYWRKYFARGRSTDWDLAVNNMLRACETAGRITERKEYHVAESAVERRIDLAKIKHQNVIRMAEVKEANRRTKAYRAEYHASLKTRA